VLSAAIFVLRYGLGSGNDRLLVVNLGVEVILPALSDPLLAPPFGCGWILEWSSEAVRYGGSGRVSFDPTTACGFPGESALLLRAERQSGERRVQGVGD
jgi:maltooligosyltrehalose trehalohydrolase